MTFKYIIVKRLAKKVVTIKDNTEISLLAGLHKARLYANEITSEEKEISRQWLKDNGFTENIF